MQLKKDTLHHKRAFDYVISYLLYNIDKQETELVLHNIDHHRATVI